MHLQLLVSSVSYLSALLAVILAISAWYRRNLPDSRIFALLMVASGIYACGFGFEIQALSLDAVLFWTHIEYIGVVWIPTLLILFSLRFAGVTLRFERSVTIGLCSLSFLLFLGQLTTVSHGLFYSDPKLTSTGSMLILRISKGPLYYILLVYHITSFVVAVSLCVRRITKTLGIFRQQALVVLGGFLTPMFCYLLYINGFSGGLDINPISFPAMGLVVTYGFMRANLFDISPVALRVVFDSMREGCIIIDGQGRIIDFNRAMDPLLPSLCADCLGQRAWKMFDAYPALIPLLDAVDPREIELIVHGAGEVRCFKVCLSIIPGRNGAILGRTLVFVDTSREYHLTLQLRELATHDALTGLFSRRHFFELAQQSFLQAQRGKHSLAVVMMDIDFFKLINDSYGHMAGDVVLTETAKLLKQSIRSCDILCRYGGEEFLLVLPETSLAEAFEVAERIRMAIAASVKIPDTPDVPVNMSLGVSAFIPEAAFTLDTLIQRADAALYTAKNTGRNRVCS